ncbi:MAG: autotransporter-associated beta strand repeat-containing protein [Verrucomicrobiales bacterium]|nr:autotransporter-associated beta strand repeat-containing protein [Verrucomicrobiales bacterium]
MIKPLPIVDRVRKHLALLFIGTGVLLCETRADDVTWNGGGSDSNWDTDANWDDPASATDTLIFSGTTRPVTINDFADNTPFAGIQFTNTTAGEDFSLSGNVINLTGDITSTASLGSILDTIALDLQLTGGTRTINLGVNHDLTVSGIISDDGSNRILIKEGAGTLTLTQNNTYGGKTELRDGTTVIMDSGALNGVIEMEDGSPVLALGADALNVSEEFFIRNAGGTKTIRLDLSGSNTGTLGNTITVNESGPGKFLLDVGDDDTLTVSGQITLTAAGGAGVTKTGLGTLILSNSSNDYTGLTSVEGGTLQVGANNVLGDSAAGNGTVVSDGATLALLGDVNYTGLEELSLAGTGVNGVGALHNLSGDNSYAGVITLNSSTLIGSTAGSLTLTGGIDGSGRALTFDGAGDITLTAGVTASGSLTKNGSGTLTLGAAGTQTGATQLNNGTTVLTNSAGLGNSTQINMNTGTTETVLELGADGLTVTNDFFIRNGGDNLARIIRLDLAGTNTGTFSGQFINNETSVGDFVINVGEADTLTMSGNIVETSGVGTSGLTKTGSGTLKLSNTGNNYRGVTAITEGVLEISGDNTLGSTDYGSTVSTGATLALNGGFSYNAAEEVTISGTGHDAEGAINNLSGDNTFAGIITLAATASIHSTADTLTLTGGINRTGNALLTVEGPGNITISSNPLTGTGTFRKEGTGTLTLSDSNTYTGVTDLIGGTTIILDSEAFGNSSEVNMKTSDTILEFGSDGLEVANTFFIRNDGAVKTIQLDLSGSNTGEITGDFTINDISNGKFITDVGADDTLTLSGNLISTGGGGGAGITKTGEGTLTLSGNNTYLGATTVESGTILINGTSSANSGVVVGAGGTLGGSGGIISGPAIVNGGNSTITTGGTLSAGNSDLANDIGTLNFTGNLSATAATGPGNNATWLVDLNNTLTGGSDLIALGDISSRTIDLTQFDLVVNDFNTFNGESGFTYDIASYSGTGGSVSHFSGLENGDNLTGLGGGQFQISYGHDLGGGSYSIRLTAVPEPSTFLLLLPFLFFGIWLAKRRQAGKGMLAEK